MNTYAKMRRGNAKVKEYLKKKGIEYIHIQPHSRYFKDIFGVGDILYIEKGKLKIGQIKTNSWGDLRAVKKFVKDTGIPITVFMVRDRNEIKERVIK